MPLDQLHLLFQIAHSIVDFRGGRVPFNRMGGNSNPDLQLAKQEMFQNSTTNQEALPASTTSFVALKKDATQIDAPLRVMPLITYFSNAASCHWIVPTPPVTLQNTPSNPPIYKRFLKYIAQKSVHQATDAIDLSKKEVDVDITGG